MSAVQKYLERHDHAVRTRSKEMRLDMPFASELASSIAVVLGQNTELSQQVIELQKKIIEQSEESPNTSNDVVFDAGRF